ncbi:unnamed protein product [Rotaria magnacalcarata]|uniref:O-acyltransferase n=3 Tax=Rotaria magnacalcarata TaxID=392030 RepID=A0A816SJJ1_9BILA|nr:unnamed protein product [Rotaria magnacalcarata]CAF2147184.1 unnamed protein product [Rotaria magnacalcarata]CAF3949870.1 unnamed protein product [Rotaria magnacalcarata]CAF3970213.1 unnamed protein product [Rotaria magnacalcarata]
MSDLTKHMSTNDDLNYESFHSVKISIKHRRTGEFTARRSLLTDLFQITHINCIRNAFVAGFFLLISRQAINDLLHYGRFDWTFDLLKHAVGKLHIVAFVWCLMTLSTLFIVFYSTYMWASNRKFTGFYLKLYDFIWSLIYVFYIAGLLVIPTWQIIKQQLPIASAAIILGEQLRQMMKTHSFMRENVDKILQQSKSSKDKKLSFEFSHFTQYFYFIFAPTLLYRDHYPRTSKIQWNIVMQMFGQFMIILCLVYHIVAYFWVPIFQRFFTDDEITLEFAISTIFDLMLPGVLIVILAFYGFFHCWLNGFAELLRFDDRMFYEDWWNLTSAATFWRSWNVVVHDWLYVYVYKDMSKLLNGNRNLSATCVVIVSALFHEYFMIITLGFFSPVLIGWFGIFGMLFRFSFPRAKGTQWNIVLLAFVPICVAVIPYFYVLEVSARYFPAKRKTFWNMVFNSEKQMNNEL